MFGTNCLRARLLCQRLALYQRKFHTLRPTGCQSAAAANNNHNTANLMKLFQSEHFARSLNFQSIRCIKTTKKNTDSHIEVYDPEYANVKKPKGPQTAEEFADVSSQKNWISYGFDYVDQKNDSLLMHSFFFSFITLSFIGFLYLVYYYPDLSQKDWSLREAYLLLDHREKNGLPLIDPNLVDPAKIQLPTDAELGSYEIHL